MPRWTIQKGNIWTRSVYCRLSRASITCRCRELLVCSVHYCYYPYTLLLLNDPPDVQRSHGTSMAVDFDAHRLGPTSLCNHLIPRYCGMTMALWQTVLYVIVQSSNLANNKVSSHSQMTFRVPTSMNSSPLTSSIKL